MVRARLGAAVIATAAAAAFAAGCGGSAGSAARDTEQPAGRAVLHILFPDGFTRAQMAGRVDAVRGIAKRSRHVTMRATGPGYLAATRSSAVPGRFAGDGKRRPLEGFLFPAKYAFYADDPARRIVQLQLDAFRSNWSKLDLRYARSKNLTPYDVLIIASMIQGEVVAPEERRLVAAVIYNRLHLRMPLGIDATLRYGLHIPPTESITTSQLQSNSPYNTRKLRGLPPTPISNPGLAAMRAAAHPAKVPYLYFARKKDKRHHYFTADYQAFLRFLKANGYG
jgi:cell division protein YceG involved in septum cleavage